MFQVLLPLLVGAAVASQPPGLTNTARQTAVRFYECLMDDKPAPDCANLLHDPGSFMGETWTGRRGGPAAGRAWSVLRRHRAVLDLGARLQAWGDTGVLVRYLVRDLEAVPDADRPLVYLGALVNGVWKQVLLPLNSTGDPLCPYAVNVTALTVDGAYLEP